MLNCENCGTENKDGAKFCKNCGASVTAGDPSPSSETLDIDIRDELFKEAAPLAPLALSSPDLDANTELSLDLDEVSPVAKSTQTEMHASKPVDLNKKSSPPDAVISGDVIKSSMPASQVMAIAAGLLLVTGVLAGGYFWILPGTPAIPVVETVESETSIVQNQAVVSSVPVAMSASAPALSAPAPIAEVEPTQNSSIVAIAEPVTASVPAVASSQNVKKKVKKNSDDEFDEEDEFYDDIPATNKRHRMLSGQHQEFAGGAPTPFSGAGMGHGQVAALLARSDSFLASGDYDRAIATAQSALSLDPGNAAAKARIKKARRLQGE